jgi:cytidine deaminase
MATQFITASLTKDDEKLIETAKSLVKPTDVPGGKIKEVGCALMTKNGKIYTGVSLHLCCGIGFCGEHSAISNMISHSDETDIITVVAFGDKIMYPCGRCRELIQQINKANRDNCQIIISGKEKVRLNELLPGDWMERD